MPRQGWLNDPCALGYDAATGTYHVGFQWNPNGTEWGNISWGGAHSRELVSWTVLGEPTLAPARAYDCAGVFTGCLLSSEMQGSTEGAIMTCIYTAAKQLPIHYTIPYTRGSETVVLAVSSDAGRTWTPFAKNPVVAEPPPELDVTGWRDPYVAPWPVVYGVLQSPIRGRPGSIMCSVEKASLYAILSGGIRGKTPTTFVYQVDGASLDRWRYLGPLIEPGLNFSPCPRWVGDFGANWEVCNFVTLADPASGASRDFFVCGVESRRPTPEELQCKGEFRATHAQMWMSGPIQREGHVPKMRYRVGGVLDHGAYYAANSFWDPQTEQQVVFGWLLEDDLAPELRERQGWAGVLSLPRVLKLLVLRSVVGALVSGLETIRCVEWVAEDDPPTRYTGYSLCGVPDPRLEKLRLAEQALSITPPEDLSPRLCFAKPLASWEARIAFSLGRARSRVGFSILHGHGEHPSTKSLIVTHCWGTHADSELTER